jgi:hypothetical protein
VFGGGKFALVFENSGFWNKRISGSGRKSCLMAFSGGGSIFGSRYQFFFSFFCDLPRCPRISV